MSHHVVVAVKATKSDGTRLQLVGIWTTHAAWAAIAVVTISMTLE